MSSAEQTTDYTDVGRVIELASKAGCTVLWGREGVRLKAHAKGGDEVVHPDAGHAAAWLTLTIERAERQRQRNRARRALQTMVYGNLDEAAMTYVRASRALQASALSGHDLILQRIWTQLVAGTTGEGRLMQAGPVNDLIEAILNEAFPPMPAPMGQAAPEEV